MPIQNGRFTPRPWEPLTDPLFDVIAPDSDEDLANPSKADWRWYNQVRDETAKLLQFLVRQVDKNYRLHRGVAFKGAVVAELMHRCSSIAKLLGDGATKYYVNQQANRCAKQWGLIVYSREPGDRYNWPMPGRPVNLPDLRRIADESLHGRWPHPPEPADDSTK